MQNNWILVDTRPAANANHVDASTFALETFETHLGKWYVLPESNVFLVVRTDDGAWEIWEGFRAGTMEKIQVHKHGTVTSDGLRTNDNRSISSRADLRGVSLKATTVVSGFRRNIVFSQGTRKRIVESL